MVAALQYLSKIILRMVQTYTRPAALLAVAVNAITATMRLAKEIIIINLSYHLYLQSQKHFMPIVNSHKILHPAYISSYSFDTTGTSFPYGST